MAVYAGCGLGGRGGLARDRYAALTGPWRHAASLSDVTARHNCSRTCVCMRAPGECVYIYMCVCVCNYLILHYLSCAAADKVVVSLLAFESIGRVCREFARANLRIAARSYLDGMVLIQGFFFVVVLLYYRRFHLTFDSHAFLLLYVRFDRRFGFVVWRPRRTPSPMWDESFFLIIW